MSVSNTKSRPDEKLNQQCSIALHRVSETPGLTAGEWEAYIGDSSFHKRLSDLARLGRLVRGDKRKCMVSGRPAVTWHPCPPEAS